MLTAQFAISTTPVQVANRNPGTAGETASITVKNTGAVVVWLGDLATDASASGGYPLAASEVLTVHVPGGELVSLWAATASGTSTVAVLTA